VLIGIWCCMAMVASAQPVVGNSELSRELFSKAKEYVGKKDFPNAILVYNQLAQLEPRNLIYRRELAYTYYLSGDYTRATQVITPLLKADDADEATFLTATKIFTARKMLNNAFDAVDDGLKKFPNSGMLYADKGTLYTLRKRYDKAEDAWEKGVERDPNYHMNYYNLTKSYFVSKRPIWAIIYGETFVNLEKYSLRTGEVKKILFDSYKQLISNAQLNKYESEAQIRRNNKSKSDFEKIASGIYANASNLVLGGVDIDNVTMMRTRFLLEWVNKVNGEYPYALFSYLNSIAEQGHFPAYNQWLFGQANNEKQYTNWAKTHANELNLFEQFFRSQTFRTGDKQYYK
jgi:tetratricopeptide (TPR) repeat protein